MNVRRLRRDSTAVCLALVSLAAVGCSREEAPAPPVATPTVNLSRPNAPLGSPVDVTYRFAVASDVRFNEDYRVMVHVVDVDEEMMWTDDHQPPVPTSQWKAGETVEYTRTIFVPIYPYVGEASIVVGLYSTKSDERLPLAGEDVGQRSYRVTRLQLLPQTENVFTVFKDGWHAAEVAQDNASVEWQWTKKDATLAFKNPKKDSVFYLDVDNPAGVLNEPQQVQVLIGNDTIDQFTLRPQEQQLRKIKLSAAQLGSTEMAELRIAVDKTFIPALVTAANSKDSRELGIRVFHAFVDSR
jgi:hypothetical protein